MNPFLRCVNWLILLSFALGSDCPAPAFKRLYIRRHYSTNPEEETVILFKYPYSEESITMKEEYKGETETVHEFCLATGIQFILRLMDSVGDGWSPGSYVTVSTDSEVLYYQLTLLSGGNYADVNFVISPSSSDDSGSDDVFIILGSSFFVLLISGITGLIAQCVKKKQLKVTDPKSLPKSSSVVIPQQTPPVVIPQQTPPVVIPQQTPPVVIPQKTPPVVIPQQTPPVVIPQKTPPVVIPQQTPPVVIPQKPRVVLPQPRPIMLIPKKQSQVVLRQSSQQVVVPNNPVVLRQSSQQGTPVIISNPVHNGVAPTGQPVVLLRSSLPLNNSGTVSNA